MSLRKLEPGSKQVWVNTSVSSGTTELAITKGGWVRIQQCDDRNGSPRVPSVLHVTQSEFEAMVKAFVEQVQ